MTEKSKNLMEKFFRAVGLMHRFNYRNMAEFGPFANPHRGQGRVLRILKMQPEISQKELGYLLDMRAQSLSELLAKLEKAGFVTRTASKNDQRVMNIKLTNKGLAAANSSQEKGEEDDFFSFLDAEETKNLNNILDKLITELENKTGADEDEDPRAAIRARFHEHMVDLRDFGHGMRDEFRRGGFGGRSKLEAIREMFKHGRDIHRATKHKKDEE